ncbi:MAG: ferritin family protein [Desulfobacterales bacterium]|nr:ferritin family protein [Desulfobacterales bacterium]
MKFDSLEAIVDFAMEREKEAAQFYSDLAKEEIFSGSKDMFLEFAREEAKHQKLLHDFKTKGFTQSMKDYKLKWIKDIKRSDYVVTLEYRKGMAYNEILMLAMKREEKALKLYNDFLKQADSPEAQKVFKMLCQEEAKHKLSLETMYDDYMAKMGIDTFFSAARMPESRAFGTFFRFGCLSRWAMVWRMRGADGLM